MANEAAKPDSADSVEARPSRLRRVMARLARVARAARRRPLWVMFLVTGSSVLAVAGGSALHFAWLRLAVAEEPPTVALALRYLDEGQSDRAREMALALVQRAGSNYQELGPPLYILGATLSQEAAVFQDRLEQQTLYFVAARYLEQARDHGWPEGRAAAGQYLLAMGLFQAGKYAESLPELLTALRETPEHRYSLYRALASAYLLDSQPQLQEANHYLDLALQQPGLDADARYGLLVERGRLELAAGDLAAAMRTVDEIPTTANLDGRPTLLRARILMESGRHLAALGGGTNSDLPAELRQKYEAAIELLRGVEGQDQDGEPTRQASYLIGVCYRGLDDERAAETAFANTRRAHYQTPSALAARLAEAEIQLHQQRYKAALAALLEVIQDAGHPDTYSNTWVPLPQLQSRLEQCYQTLRDAAQFAAALTLSRALRSIIPADRAVAAEAQAHLFWANALMRQAGETGAPDASGRKREARTQYREASRLFTELASLQFATNQLDDALWQSAHCMLLGENYAAAEPLLHRYLEVAPQDQQARGRVALGECLLSLGRFAESRQVLIDCLAFHPRHPESYRARLLAAQACEQLVEPKALAEAKTLLEANLYHESLTTRSAQWLASKFALGELLYREGIQHDARSRTPDPARSNGDPTAELAELELAHDRFQQAIVELDEAVQRDQRLQPHSVRATRARYEIAEAWWRSARLPAQAMETAPTQARRTALMQQTQNDRTEAARAFLDLQRDLKAREDQDTAPLTEVERRILRNSYFGYADTVFDQGDYELAIKAYAAAANRYQNEPAVVEAFMQLASCYRHLGQADGARSTLLQAAAVLSWIPEDADFTETTRYDRESWSELIEWLSQW